MSLFKVSLAGMRMAYFTQLREPFVDHRFGKSSRRTKDHLFTQFLLPLDFRQQQLLPVVGTVDVAGPQLGSQTVPVAIEQQ